MHAQTGEPLRQVNAYIATSRDSEHKYVIYIYIYTRVKRNRGAGGHPGRHESSDDTKHKYRQDKLKLGGSTYRKLVYLSQELLLYLSLSVLYVCA